MAFKRLRIVFKNGFELSIVRPLFGHYEDDTYEIGLVNLDGNLDDSLFDTEHQGDLVLTHCSAETVVHYVIKLGTMKTEKRKFCVPYVPELK